MKESRKNSRKFSWLPLFTILVFLVLPGCTGSNNPLFEKPPGIVDGTILDSGGSPVKEAIVILENKVANSNSSTTDGSGTFSITTVNPGTYDLVASKTISGIVHKARRRFLTIYENTQIVREVKILPAGTIRGKVSLEGHQTHEGVRVDLIGTGRTVVTGTDGVFEFTDVAYTYREDATNSLYLYDVTLSKAGFANHTIQDITVVAGDLSVVPDVELQNLDPAGVAKVTGMVSLEAKDGAAEAVVKILGTAIQEQVILSDGSNQRTFEFNNIPTGTYVLEVSHPDFHSQEMQFTIEAGQEQKDLGTISLTNVFHYSSDRMAVEQTLSPGGNQIAYIGHYPNNNTLNRELFIMDVEGVAFNSRISNRAKGAEGAGMAWSNDGRYILYIEKNTQNIARLYRMNMISSSGGEIFHLTPYSLDIAQPAFAPSGLRLVYHKFETTGAILGATLEVKPAGPELTGEFVVIPETNDQVSKNQFTSIEFGISDRILYSKETETGYTVPLSAAGNLVLRFPIESMGSDSAAVTFDPPNERIAYVIKSGSTAGTYIANIDGTLPERISLAVGASLEFGKHGKYIYFIDTRTGKEHRMGRIIVPRHLRSTIR